MKNLLLKISCFVLLWIMTLIIVFVLVEQLPPQFSESYQAAIFDKYENLLNTSSPKIILVGGSSGGISFDAEQMEKEIGKPVVNMALHASFGIKLQTEMVKGNIQKGDIIVLAYEYQNWENASVFDAELVVTGLDGHLSLYKYISPEHYINVVQYFPKYMFTKIDSLCFKPYLVNQNWIYCRKAFDSKGNINFSRLECEMPDPLPEEGYVRTCFIKENISDESITYVNDFIAYAHSKGATVLISFPPFFEEAIVEGGNVDEYQKYLQDSLNAPIISTIDEYVFPREYMYDSPYHCNDLGTWVRTHSLAWDITNYENGEGYE